LQWEHKQAIPAGTCWWRISLLDDASLATSPSSGSTSIQLTHLGGLKITSILGTPQSTQPWAISVLMNSCTNKLQIAIAKSPLLLHPHSQREHDSALLPTRDSVF